MLSTGRDFVFIDFEGEPARPLSERRIKRSPLRDVAGMVRSFDYAARAALGGRSWNGARWRTRPSASERFGGVGGAWSTLGLRGVPARVLRRRRRHHRAALVADTEEELAICLEAHVLEKAVYELGYELAHRPDWVGVPLHGILDLLEEPV